MSQPRIRCNRSWLVVLAFASLVCAEARAQEGSLPEVSDASAPTVDGVASAPTGSGVGLSHRERFRQQLRAPGSTRLLTSLISSVGFGPELLWGAGLSLRLDHYPTGLPVRLGGFFQSEVLTDGAVRIAAGLQGGAWMMGCQVGLAYRFESDRYWSTLGLQIGKSIDFGIFSLGGRLVVPLVDVRSEEGQSPATLTSTGIEGAVFVSVGLPTTLEGQPPRCGCSHGRRPPGADADDER